VKIKKEFKVGLVVIISIGLLIFGFNFLKGIDIFKKETKIYALYEKNDGLMEASPLLISGFKVGQVNKLDLIQCDTSYKVLVTFILNDNVSIPKNSIARLVSQDLLGTKAVSIEMGDSLVMLNAGDTLKTALEIGLKDEVNRTLQPLKIKIDGLIGNMDSVVTIVNQIMNSNVRNGLIESFESIRNAVIALNHSSHKIDTMITQEQGRIVGIINKINSITENINNNNEKISHVINNFSNISDSLAQANVKSTIENTNHALTQANIILDQINKGEGSVGKLLKNDSLYVNLNKSAQDLDKLMKDIRINPDRYLHFSVFGRKNKPLPIGN
jgi:phospholipid/cholesterol/gamma-HCH transport system substrate-binding protein